MSGPVSFFEAPDPPLTDEGRPLLMQPAPIDGVAVQPVGHGIHDVPPAAAVRLAAQPQHAQQDRAYADGHHSSPAARSSAVLRFRWRGSTARATLSILPARARF